MVDAEKCRLRLPPAAQAVIGRLEEAGLEGVAVGGCVRDLLLGREPGDVDIATSALPEQVMEVFSDCRRISVGLRHGTVCVIWRGEPVEITTYRRDGAYSDGRHPDGVVFTGRLEEDLARRDFTINGMAYSGRRGLVDRFGGLEDLERPLIRPIGEGERRFREDALRILRAFRFQAQLSFALSAETTGAAAACAPLLRRVSPERITAELSRLLVSPDAGRAVCSMAQAGILSWILPPVGEPILQAVGRSAPQVSLRLALLLSPLDGGEAENRLSCLRLARDRVEEVRFCLEHRSAPCPQTIRETRQRMHQWGVQPFLLLCRFCGLLHPSEGKGWQAAAQWAKQILENGECWSLPQLAVNGRDVQRLGFTGKAVGRALEQALQWVISGELPNEKACLLGRLQKEQGAVSSGAEKGSGGKQ